jgi:hypothetical protein
MEEAKTQENKKLKQQLQELQVQSKETKDLLKKEQETTKEALEKAALVPEVHVDVTRVDELTTENEKLKVVSFSQWTNRTAIILSRLKESMGTRRKKEKEKCVAPVNSLTEKWTRIE